MAKRGRPRKSDNIQLEVVCEVNIADDLLPQLIGEPGEADINAAMELIIQMDRFFEENIFLEEVYEWAFRNMQKAGLLEEEEVEE